MKKVLAVSGGIDSMVLLDMMMQESKPDETVVATFDHGTREAAKDDVAFVKEQAQSYGIKCVTEKVELGENVSEELARDKRYNFLRQVATGNPTNGDRIIFTAHHLDDLVESVAINLIRGTGWRGLAVLDAEGVERPFLKIGFLPANLQNLVPVDKKTVIKYAAEHKIVFRQDPTNTSERYLRNRVREKLVGFEKKREIYDLWLRQLELKREIERILEKIVPDTGRAWEREWFDRMEENVAIEMLRLGTLRAGISATRPQLLNFLEAIKTYKAGKYFNLPQDRLVKFSKTQFVLSK